MKAFLVRSVVAVSVVGLAIACSSTKSADDDDDIVDTNDASTNDSSTSDGGGLIKTSCTGDERITFKIKSADSSAKYCSGHSGNDCAPLEFVTVKNPDGTPLGTLHRNCRTLCEDGCEQITCAAGCPVPSLIGEEGVTLLWDGTFFQEKESTCASGSNAGMHCTDTACAAAGSYIATLCAYPIDSETAADAGSSYEACMGVPSGAQPKCVDVSFTWPPEAGTVVEGVLAP